MYVEKLTLKNYRGIRDLTIDFDRHLNVFVGDNGCGKSTILDAIRFGIIGMQPDSNYIYGIPNNDVLQGSSKASFAIDIQSNNDVSKRVFKSGFNFSKKNPYRDFNELKGLGATFFYADRKIINSPTSLIDKLKTQNWIVKAEDWYNEHFNNSGVALAWIQEQENIENAAFRDHIENDDPLEAFKPNASLKAVKDVIRDITGFKKFSFSASENSFSFTKQAGKVQQKLQFAQLSLGEKAFVGLIATIAFHIASYSEDQKKPLNAEHVIVIDEIDLHLHPKWQRQIIPALLKHFPKCQFIVTTHSPQVLGEVSAKHIHLLERNDDGDIVSSQPERSRGLSSSDILTEVMSQDAVTKQLLELVDEIYSLIDNEEFSEAHKRLKNAEREYGEVPELVGVRSYLELSE